jgi:hypothetical protein
MRDFIYCLFFPHPSNNHRAHVLHPKAILLLISFFIFSSLFFSSNLNPLAGKIRAYADISVQELLNNTNQKRAENGLQALVTNDQLSIAASRKADDMFAKNYWAHNSPDGTTPWVFIKQSGYDYVYAGENLARGFTSAADVVNAWMASPGHRANLLSSNFKDVGFAVKSGTLNGEQTFLVVQEFGSKNYAPIARKNTQKKVVSKKVLGFDVANLPLSTNFSKSAEITIILILGFISILLVDLIVVERRKIVRFVGHNLDHAIFLFAIVIVLGILSGGVIV